MKRLCKGKVARPEQSSFDIYIYYRKNRGTRKNGNGETGDRLSDI